VGCDSRGGSTLIGVLLRIDQVIDWRVATMHDNHRSVVGSTTRVPCDIVRFRVKLQYNSLF
jgi:hypothetical protein